MAANAVKLERGELYVDIPPGSRGSDRFMVITPAGEFRHVGTQFAVAIVNGMTRLRVREGSVLWHAAEGDSTVNAGTEVVIDRNRTVTQPAHRHRGARVGLGGVHGAGLRNRKSSAAGVPGRGSRARQAASWSWPMTRPANRQRAFSCTATCAG